MKSFLSVWSAFASQVFEYSYNGLPSSNMIPSYFVEEVGTTPAELWLGSVQCSPKGTQSTSPRPPRAGEPVPHNYIVNLRSGVDARKHLASVTSMLSLVGTCEKGVQPYLFDHSFLLSLGTYTTILNPSAAAALRSHPDVESVTEDVYIATDGVVGRAENTSYLASWTTTQNNPWSLARLNSGSNAIVPSGARDRTSLNWPFKFLSDAGVGIDVYVIDTGVNNHVDLVGKITRKGFNTVAPNLYVDTDAQGHGTRMAGIIAGERTGVAKFAKVIPIRAGDDQYLSQASTMRAIDVAVGDATRGFRVAVINVSAGMYTDRGDRMLETVRAAVDAGMIVVNSAGNTGYDECATRVGSSSGAITVGNADIRDERRFNSNFGPCVDVYAPGTDIVTPNWQNYDTFLTGQAGTSEASAAATGLAATLLSQNTRMTPRQIKDKIKDMAVRVVRDPYQDVRDELLIQAPSSFWPF